MKKVKQRSRPRGRDQQWGKIPSAEKIWRGSKPPGIMRIVSKAKDDADSPDWWRDRPGGFDALACPISRAESVLIGHTDLQSPIAAFLPLAMPL